MSYIWEEEVEQEFNTIVAEAFKIDVFSYNGEVTDNFWAVLSLIGEAKEAEDSIFNTGMASLVMNERLKDSQVESKD